MRNQFGLLILLTVITACLFACKEDAEDLYGNNEELRTAAEQYHTAPSPQTANSLIREIMTELGSTSTDSARQVQLLELGYKTAEAQNLSSRVAAFLFPLIKMQPDHPDLEDRIFELAKLMQKMNKPTAANILFKGLSENYPSYANADEAGAAISEDIPSIEEYLSEMGRQIFVDPDNTGINREAALKFVDASEAFATVYPDHPQAPEYLFKAAEVAKSIRTYAKSLSLYDWIIDNYSGYNKAPTALFLKGFIIENNLGDDDKAREIYEQFLATYPDHDLADDIEFLIENLGKTDEEILEMIEKKRKEKELENTED